MIQSRTLWVFGIQSRTLWVFGIASESEPNLVGVRDFLAFFLAFFPRMSGKKESEMRGLSVFFIASVLPSLIKGVGEIYGDFNEEGRWVKKGPLSPEDARPYDVDKPLFREKSKAQTCPRDGQPGCAFVDYVHTVRPSHRLLVLAHFRASYPQTCGGENTGRAKIMLSYSWSYTFGSIGSALMAFCEKHGLDPRTTHVWICCMCVNQHRLAGGQSRANRMRSHGGESSASRAQARR